MGCSRRPALLALLCLCSLLPLARSGIPGADPTGQKDSAPALNAEIRRLCGNTTLLSRTLGWQGNGLAPVPINTLLDLANGVYRLDSPLAIDSSVTCTGVLQIRHGTLLAGAGLGAHGNSSFLVTVLNYWSGLGVQIEDVVFANNGTGGGLRVDAAHHVHVLGCNFLNFEKIGIWGSNLLGMGHDLVVDRCRLTECTAGMAACADITVKKATAIVMHFPDSHFRNTVITCARKGIENHAGANNFNSLHIWPTCNPHATGDNLTVAFDEMAGMSRISNCYFDNSIFRVSGYRGTVLINSYFNGHAKLVLANSTSAGETPDPGNPECQYWKGAMCGLHVANNLFSCSNGDCATIVPEFAPKAADQMFIGLNAFENASAVAVCTSAATCQGAACQHLFAHGSACDASLPAPAVHADAAGAPPHRHRAHSPRGPAS